MILFINIMFKASILGAFYVLFYYFVPNLFFIILHLYEKNPTPFCI